jgi:plasmid stabilization system protein ParE
MVCRVEISAPALIDAEKSFLWIRENSPEKAKDWYEGLLKAVFSLEKFPKRCSIAPESQELGLEIRQLLYGKKKQAFRILFSVSVDFETGEEVVQIYRIRHISRNYLNELEIFGDDEDYLEDIR